MAVTQGLYSCDDSSTLLPVKCFYRNAAASLNVVADTMVRVSDNCSHSTTQKEEFCNGMPKQQHVVPAKPPQPFGGKQVKNANADRKPKTVERKMHLKIKHAGRRMNPPRAAICNTLMFKTLDNNLQLTESGEGSANTARAAVEKENRLKDSHIKRFFKNRTTNIRKHVTSVGGRCVNIGSLSKSSNNEVSTKLLKTDVIKSSPLGCSSTAICSSTSCSNNGDKMNTIMLGAEIDSCLGENTEWKYTTHTTPDRNGVAPFQRSSCSGFEANVVLLEVKELEASSTTTDLVESSDMPSIQEANNQDMLSSPLSTATGSTPRHVALRSPVIRSSPRTPSTPVNRNLALISPSLNMKRKSDNTPSKLSVKKDRKEQMILDFGQKLHGTVNCTTCGMTYAKSHPDDELMHSQYHRDLFRTLHFTGKNSARVAQDFLDGSYVVVVTDDDRRLSKRVEGIKRIVDKELGFVIEGVHSSYAKIFLYVSLTQVCGFCLAMPTSWGYRMQNFGDPSKTQCCSEEPVPVRCAISRIWVLASHRRKGIASRLLDVVSVRTFFSTESCSSSVVRFTVPILEDVLVYSKMSVRGHFLMGYPLSTNDIAFSDPTPDGAKFAAKYCQTDHFLVYNKNSA